MKIKTRDLISYLYLIIVIVFFFEPEIIVTTNERINKLFIMGRYIITGIEIIKLFNTRKISKFLIAMFAYEVLIIFSTKLNELGNVSYAIRNAISCFGICLIVGNNIENNPKILVKSISLVLNALVLINFATLFLYPEGMYSAASSNNNWFLGYDNLHIITIVPAMVFSLVSYQYTNKRVYDQAKLISIFLVSIISVFMRFSATSVVATITFIICILLANSKYSPKKLYDTYLHFYIMIAMFFGIIILRLQNIFIKLINILGKDLTFTGRTDIWDKVIYYIKKSPFIGYGQENNAVRELKNGRIGATHSHNNILEVIYKGGIIGIVLFCYLIFITAKEIKKYNKYFVTKVVATGILAFMIMMLMEARDKPGFYLILTLGFYIRFLVNGIEKYSKKGNKVDEIV